MVFHEQNGYCHYCNIRMTMQLHRHDTCTVEHIITRSNGGSHDKDNVVGACFTCNNARGDLNYEAFKQFVHVYGRGVRPYDVLRDLWKEEHREVAQKHKGMWAALAGVTIAPIDLKPLEPKWKRRRALLYETTDAIRDVVDRFPVEYKNAIILKHQREQKEAGDG